MSKLITTTIQGYYDEKIKAWVTNADEKVLEQANAYADELANGTVADHTAAIEKLNQDVAANKLAAENADKALGERIDGVEGDVGNLEDLETTSKEDLVKAINEVRNSVSAGGTAAAITIDTTTTSEGAVKSYTLKQGTNTVGVIDIPKDMVVESGEVVNNPAGQAAGTYIKLVLANVAEPLYINVGTLVDIYKAAANATQVQLAIDSSTREISATIVAGSIGTTELADGAVTTVKIADANVTLAKLSTAVQASLGKADSAVQSVTEGATNGTIKVDGTEVPVHGLGSAAYTASNAYDAAGSANAVDEKLTAYKTSNDTAVAEAKKAGTDASAALEAYKTTNNAAVAAAQADVDALEPKMTAAEEDIADHESRIAALEGVEYATTADIDAMFP